MARTSKMEQETANATAETPENTEDTVTTPTEEDTVTQESTQTAERPDVDELANKLNEARTNEQNAREKLQTAMSSGDMDAAMAASDEVKAAANEVKKAEHAYNGIFREQLSAQLHDTVAASLAELDIANLRGIGITGVGVIFNEDGSAEVTVQYPRSSAKSRTRQPGTGGGRGSAKGNWIAQFEGNAEYSSAQLLLTFGGEKGAMAVDKARNYENYGYKYSPGFDAPVKQLAKRMGWNGESDNRVLTHPPTEE